MKKILAKCFKPLLGFIFSKELLISRRRCQKNRIALTFDDGPHPENTEKILTILKREGIRATFFLSGESVVKYSRLAKRIADEGHQIGNHSFYHKRVKELGYRQYIEGVEKTEELLCNSNTFTINRKFFRPPYGELNPRFILYALMNKMKIVNWTFDSGDSHRRSSTELREYLKSALIRDGEILLFHEDYEHTPELLPDFISDLKARGFTFSTVEEFLE